MISKLLSLGALAVVTSGCAGFIPSGEVANGSGHAKVAQAEWANAAAEKPVACTNQPYAFEPTKDLRHTRNELFVKTQGDARAHGRDAVVRVGADAIVEAKFSYGKLAKDLQDEDVTLHVRGLSCTWTHVGTVATDDRGIATFRVPGKLLSEPGRYAFEAVLQADGEAAPGAIYAIDGSTRAVVFDVDETLTTGNDELIEQLLLGAEPEMRKDANKVVQEWARAGWFVTYLTGRPHQLTDITRKWLTKNGFPDGLVRTAESLRVSMKGDATELYKHRTLEDLKKVGLDVQYAYGNATTDICAYAKASISPANTFILGPHAGARCGKARPTLALASYSNQLGVPIMRLTGGLDLDKVATTPQPASADAVADVAKTDEPLAPRAL